MTRKSRAAQVNRDDRAIEGHLERGEPIPFNLRELYLWRCFERAQAQYEITTWDGKATLFRAEEVEPFFGGGGASYGWDQDIRGGVDVVIVPGHHNNLLLGSNAELLVRSLTAAIDRVTESRPELAARAR